MGTHPGKNRHVHPAYFETLFTCEPPDAQWPERFVLLTAWATTGQCWPLERNQQADRELQRRLQRDGHWHHRVTGYSPTTGHTEPGWAVALDWQLACDLCLEYLQDALYVVDGDALYVTHCDERRVLVAVGDFRPRLRAG
jgi:hypothetical protein